MDTITSPLASIGIDIGKEVFHIVGFGIDGKIAFRREIKRLALAETFKKLPPCVVGAEKSVAAFAQRLRELGWTEDRGHCRRLRCDNAFAADHGAEYIKVGGSHGRYRDLAGQRQPRRLMLACSASSSEHRRPSYQVPFQCWCG
jgi:hypothetical protein